MENNVNIIIVNYKCWEYTITCVKSLLQTTHNAINIYIVDNNSNDKSVIKIEEWCKNQKIKYKTLNTNTLQYAPKTKQNNNFITIIKSDVNEGFGSGNNIVLKYLLKNKSHKEYIWLLNPDTEVEKDVIVDLLEKVNGRNKVICGNLIYYFNRRNEIMYYGGFKVKKFIHGVVNITKSEDINRIDAIAGTSLFTQLSTFYDIGVLPEKYFMYWEETDFCTLAKNAGYKFIVNDRSKVFDHVGVTSKTKFLPEYLYLLNGLRFYKKYYPYNLPIILLSTIAKLVILFFLNNRIKKRAVFFAHIDFFKLLVGMKVDIKERIKNQ